MTGTIKLTKKEIGKKLVKLAPKFPRTARMEYAIKNEIGLSTIYQYLNGNVTSAIIGNHLLEHIQQFIKSAA